jgi:MSHA pilin protein MshC
MRPATAVHFLKTGRKPSPLTFSGFTLIELIAAILVVGILVAIAAPRLFGSDNFRARSLAEEAAAAIRYGQKLAVASQCRIQATVNRNVIDAGGTQYVVYALHYLDCVVSPPERVARPQAKGSSTRYFETDSQGVSLTGDLQVVFDAEGVPQGLSAPAVVQVGPRRLTVEPGSGLVHVQ